jgi:uncharacterized phage-associated protein
MVPVSQVAKYILTLSDPDQSGELISNLKLQKLLYYVQGFHLVMRGETLFDEKIYNWQHGPVVREVYQEYAANGSAGIQPPADFDIESIPAESREVIDEVYQVYGQFSAWRLRDMTHEESPWCTTDRNEEITLEKLQTFFQQQVA